MKLRAWVSFSIKLAASAASGYAVYCILFVFVINGFYDPCSPIFSDLVSPLNLFLSLPCPRETNPLFPW
jgi:hypothetical protein